MYKLMVDHPDICFFICKCKIRSYAVIGIVFSLCTKKN